MFVFFPSSAGVGRTGTFIALDFLMQFVNNHNLDDEVDIYNLVLNMRHNRPIMVQSEVSGKNCFVYRVESQQKKKSFFFQFLLFLKHHISK